MTIKASDYLKQRPTGDTIPPPTLATVTVYNRVNATLGMFDAILVAGVGFISSKHPSDLFIYEECIKVAR